jgi:hypothetical protein
MQVLTPGPRQHWNPNLHTWSHLSHKQGSVLADNVGFPHVIEMCCQSLLLSF